VLDLSLWQPGHVATQLLADLGADVLKVEPPGGDRMRPNADKFINFNGRKRSIVLNLKDSDDLERFLDLVRGVEVVVENYRPGVADRLGVGFEALRSVKPSIVVCSISGFGQTGPLSTSTGHDPGYQAYAGAQVVTGSGRPIRPGLLAGDQGGGLAAAFAILAAVLCSRRSGEGEHIDVSITDLLASWVAPLGQVDERRQTGSSLPARLPAMREYRTLDEQWVVLGVYSEDRLWDELCHGLGMERFSGLSMTERAERYEELVGVIEQEIARWKRDDLIDHLGSLSVPAAPVLSRKEMMRHRHFRERGVIATGHDGLVTIGHPIRYAVHPALPPGRPPGLDEH
jgi:crotonobetainyl-CoA:carnitine CoA-transferase CaiB-like acyl-CoA transferase